MHIQQKAYAFITHGDHLLVFAHRDHPEAGIQIPGGTIEAGETPDQAVRREAFEETGLTELVFSAYLGKELVQLPERDLWQERHFYHLRCEQETPSHWSHIEHFPSEGDESEIALELYWVKLPDQIPPLINAHARMLETLLVRLALR